MKFALTMNMDNAAFGETGMDRAEETNRVLSSAMGVLSDMHEDYRFGPGWKQKLLDSNGNVVGMMEVS